MRLRHEEDRKELTTEARTVRNTCTINATDPATKEVIKSTHVPKMMSSWVLLRVTEPMNKVSDEEREKRQEKVIASNSPIQRKLSAKARIS